MPSALVLAGPQSFALPSDFGVAGKPPEPVLTYTTGGGRQRVPGTTHSNPSGTQSHASWEGLGGVPPQGARTTSSQPSPSKSARPTPTSEVPAGNAGVSVCASWKVPPPVLCR